MCRNERSAHGNDPFSSLAELEVIGANGKPLPHDKWAIWYVSSEETAQENAAAENLMDGDPGTFWHSEWGSRTARHPYTVVIDLGEIHEGIRGLRLTERADRTSGRVNQFRAYARPQFFLSKDG